MSCCGSKTLDGLGSGTAGGTFEGNVIVNGDIVTSGDGTIGGDLLVAGDLNVQGGDFELGVGIDGWSNIRSASAAFGLDLEAPAGKRVRFVNDVTSIVEVDTNLNLIGGTGSVGLVPSASTTTYDFIFPPDNGLATQVLTSQGPGLETYWSAGGGVGGGTVTSVDFSVAGTPFLSISGGPIFTAGVFMLSFSGTALDVANGGTGVTTATGTGSVVRQSNAVLIAPTVGVATGTSLKLVGSTSGDVTISANATGISWNFTLPANAGTNGQVLTSVGGGTLTWTSQTVGTVTSVGLVVPDFLTVSPASITNNGVFTITNSLTQPLRVIHGGTGVTTSTGTGSVVLSANPVFTGIVNTAQLDATGDISTTSTTASISTTTGALKSGGGLGVVGNANIGGTLTAPNIAGGVGGITTSGVLSTSNTTVSTSTSTGSFTSGGGAGIGGDLFVRQSVNVNYGGSIGSPQLRISPASINNAATLAFYTSTFNSGDSWVIGHAGGAGNFTVRSTNTGQDKIFVTPGGPITFPSGASSTTFVNVTGAASGTVGIRAQSAAGAWNFNLPTTAGNPGDVLTSQGGVGAAMTWTLPTVGTVTSVGLVVPDFLTVSPASITNNGVFIVTNSLTQPLRVIHGGTGVTTSTGTGNVVLSTAPALLNAVLTTPTFINPTSNNIGLQGAGGGVVSILPPSTLFSSWNFLLPTTPGSDGQVLQSKGGAIPMVWANVGTGSVTSVGLNVTGGATFLSISATPANPIVSAGTFTIGYSGTPLPIANGGTSTTTATGIVGSSVVLQDGPTIVNTMTVTNIAGSGFIRMNATSGLGGTPLHQFNTNNASNGYIAGFLNPGMPVDGRIFMMFGRQSGDAAVLSYGRPGTNPLSFGVEFFGGSGQSITVYQNNTASSSSATGALVVSGTGGLGVGGAINAGGAIANSSGGMNITGNSTINGTVAINTTGVTLPISIADASTTFGSDRYLLLGKSITANESVILGFLYRNTGQGSSASLGLAGSTSLNVYTGGLASTSTTTGTVTVNGGMGVSGAIYAGGVNITGNSTFNGVVGIRGPAFQQTISPLVTNGQTAIKFFNNINETGAGWVVGVNGGGAGADVFNIESSTFGGNLLTISPITGAVTVPRLISSSTTASTSATTGAIVTAGGLGVGGAVNTTGTVTATTSFAQSNTTSPFTFTNTTTGAANAFIIQSNLAPNLSNGADIYQAVGTGLSTNNSFLYGLKKRASNYVTMGLYGDDETVTIRNINTPSTTTTTGTLQVKGGVGVTGRVCATDFQTQIPGFPFKYSEGTFDSVMESHKLSGTGPNLVTTGGLTRWSRIGQVVFISFNVLYSYTVLNPSATWSPFLLLNMPFIVAVPAAQPLSNLSDPDIGNAFQYSKPLYVEAYAGQTALRFFNSSDEFNYITPIGTPGSYTGQLIGFVTYITNEAHP